MSPTRVLALALVVVLAGCTGAGPVSDGQTTAPTTESTTETATSTDSTTEPHTGVGTSHTRDHLSVRVTLNVDDVTVTLAPDIDGEKMYDLNAGEQLDLTREIHERGHEVRVVVERGGDAVFDQTVRGYQSYDVVVEENDTRVTQTVV